jgi:hypothetical protein
MKLTRSFLISLLALAILAVLGWRGAEVSDAIVMLVGFYVGARAGLKGSHAWASIVFLG